MINVDTRYAPLVVVRWIREIDGEQLERYFDSHDALLESEVEHALLTDLSSAQLRNSSSSSLVELSRWLDRRAEKLHRWCKGGAFVVGDNDLRQSIEVFVRLSPLEVPMRVFDDPFGAGEWLRQYIDAPELFSSPASGLNAESSTPETLCAPSDSLKADGDGRDGWSPYGARDSDDSASA